MASNEWVTLQKVCEILNVSESFLRREIKAKNITYTKFGSNYRFLRTWVDAYAMRECDKAGGEA